MTSQGARAIAYLTQEGAVGKSVESSATRNKSCALKTGSGDPARGGNVVGLKVVLKIGLGMEISMKISMKLSISKVRNEAYRFSSRAVLRALAAR